MSYSGATTPNPTGPTASPGALSIDAADESKHSTSTGDPGDDLLLSVGIHRSDECSDLALLKNIDLASKQLGRLKRSPEATNLKEIMMSEGAVHVIAPSRSVVSLEKMAESAPAIVRFSSNDSLSDFGDNKEDGSLQLTHTPKLTKRVSMEIVQRVTSARYMVDFPQFQRFILLSYALRHNLVEGPSSAIAELEDFEIYSPRIEIDPTSEYPEQDTPGIFLCCHSVETMDVFKSQLWAPDDFQVFVDTHDLDALDNALSVSSAEVGIYIIEVTEEDFEHLKKEVGHKHISGKGSGKTNVCGCYLERKCKGWRLLEQKFGDRAFCVLVQDSRMKSFFGLHADLPADMLPTYDVGHIVMWPKDTMVRIDYKKLLGNVEDELPYSWPHDILCSASQWRRIVFESQLKQLIRVTRMHSTSKRRLSRENPTEAQQSSPQTTSSPLSICNIN
eukprot:TRINITY_DN6974_c0_g1_i1.p1 TRINITY_DN6974_c0_g1~~TRINITY_DN6974_c0_g1_i1.p1  ORF type:complete len:446 (-),score=93.22 TRINITY_DN6974_c0_g1_i1:18-1355(-)